MSEPCAFWPGCLSPIEGGCADCPAAIREMEHYDDYGPYDAYDEPEQCCTCKGSGIVNPLTAPEGFLCFSVTECPTCDGTGEAP